MPFEPLTVVIITHNRKDLFYRAYSSVLTAMEFQKDEIIFKVYNSSPAPFGNLKCIEKHVPHLKTAVEKRHAAFNECQTKWIVFLDDDCEMKKNALAHIRNTILKNGNKRWGAFFSNIGFEGYRTKWFRILENTSYFDNFELCKEEEVPWSPTALSVFRTKALQSCGGFDVGIALPAGGEDVDICLRLRKNGWRLGIIPETVVFHTTETWNSLRGNLLRSFNYGKAAFDLQDRWSAYRTWDMSSIASLFSGALLCVCILLYFGLPVRRLILFMCLIPITLIMGEWIYSFSLYRKNSLDMLIFSLIQICNRLGYAKRGIEKKKIGGLFMQFDWTYLNSFEQKRSRLINRALIFRGFPLIFTAGLLSFFPM